MTDQNESASEYAELLEGLELAAQDDNNWRCAAEIEDAAAAIRALEAKVVEESLSAFEARADVARWMNACEAILKLWEGADLELRADRDRLAGEVEMYRREWHLMTVERDTLRDVRDRTCAEVARLTSELAAAKINAGNFAVIDTGQPISDAVPTYEAMAAELATAREDAERYRWLRKPRAFWDVLMQEGEDERWHDMYLDGLDAAIDAARRAGGEG